MGMSDALRRLDDRVLPQRKQAAAITYPRNTFLAGLFGVLLCLVVAIANGRWAAIGSAAGFFGVMTMGGLQWYRAARDAPRQ